MQPLPVQICVGKLGFILIFVKILSKMLLMAKNDIKT
jgi:hypothetical protein